MFYWILVRKEDNSLVWGHKSKTKPLFGNNGKETEESDVYEYIDYTDDEGNPQELPEDWNTETIDPETGEITRPVYIWDGKELVKDE